MNKPMPKLESILKVAAAHYPSIHGTREKALQYYLLEAGYHRYIEQKFTENDGVMYEQALAHSEGRMTDAELVKIREKKIRSRAKERADKQKEETDKIAEQFKNAPEHLADAKKAYLPISMSNVEFNYDDYLHECYIEESYRSRKAMACLSFTEYGLTTYPLPDDIPQDWLEGYLEILTYISTRKKGQPSEEKYAPEYQKAHIDRNDDAIDRAKVCLYALAVRFKDRLPLKYEHLVKTQNRQRTREEILKDLFDKISTPPKKD